jgi:hypothetical protein
MTEYEKINRRFEKLFFNRVRKTIDFKEVIAIIETRGITAAVTYVTNDLANPELAKEIQRLYGVVGTRHANRVTRSLRVQEKKGFGFNLEWVRFIQEYLRLHLIEKITFSVNATTRDFLLKVLQNSISEGWGVDKTVRELRESTFSEVQAARIVRTEVNTAANVGVIAAGQTYEYEMMKEWIAIRDSRTRGVDGDDHADHIHLNGVIIDFDDYFTDPKNGVRLFQPGDPKAIGSRRDVASTVINCRCNLGLKPKRDQRGRLIPKRKSTSVIYPNQIRRGRVVTI